MIESQPCAWHTASTPRQTGAAGCGGDVVSAEVPGP